MDSTFAAPTSLQLKSTVSRKGEMLTFVLTPSDSALDCTYRLTGTPIKESQILGEQIILADFPGEENSSTIIINDIIQLKGKKTTENFRFEGSLTCGNNTIYSNTSDASFNRKLKGKIDTQNKFLSQLRKKLTIFNLNLVEAYPNVGFEFPVDFQPVNDGRGKIAIVEQTGKIKFVDSASSSNFANTFLDIGELITNDNFEQGLLGLAFHPKYRKNGFFFVHYSRVSDGASVISRFKRSKKNRNIANISSEKILMIIQQPYQNHNAGQLAFGPDGFLYIALGDGGSGGDPERNGQNPKTLLGSLLRINVDRKSKGKNYAIPRKNPYVKNNKGEQKEIFAYGLRNPWRFSFDSKTGKIWLADVGQNSFEEINIIKKGKNYGWNTMEGFSCYPTNVECDRKNLTLPVHAYGRTSGTSITGGYVYRGKIKNLRGYYIYADFINGRIWALNKRRSFTSNNLLFDTNIYISSFGQNRKKELFLLSYFDGKIYKFEKSDK